MTLAEFSLKDGGNLLVCVEPEHVTRAGTRGINFDSVTERAEQTFDAALETIRTVAEGVLTQLSALARSPDEVHVDFGVQFTAKAGAVLTTAGGTAHLRVELTWKAPATPAVDTGPSGHER